jgi:hypothetical protein
MRIETVHGRNLVCGHIFKSEELASGQRWAPASGNNYEVKIVAVDGEWVTYEWEENGERKFHEKDSFSFQCRYCKVVE